MSEKFTVVEDENGELRPGLEKERELTPVDEPHDITFDEKVKALVGELALTLIAKNMDYGDSFHKAYVRFGMISAVIRMTDKLNRLEELGANGDLMVVSESLFDTAMDLAGYAILTAMEQVDWDGDDDGGEATGDERNC